MPWAQRLGYLLERVGAAEKAAPLKAYVRAHAHESAPLMPNAAKPHDARARKPERSDAWKLYINADVESDL